MSYALYTKAPSLHRRYPASSVLRASPPPQRARTLPHGRPVGHPIPRDEASRVARVLLCVHAIATTPARRLGAYIARFPSPISLPDKG